MNPKKDKKNWTSWRKANYRYFAEHLDERPSSETLVDLGAGDIQFEDLFFRFNYIGVDFQAYPHVSIVTDLTKAIPIESATADIVTLSNTIEHIPNTEHLLAEANRILVPGGTIIGTVPFLITVHQAPYDFNRYTDFALACFLENAGFTDIEVVPLGNLIDAYDAIERKFFDEVGAYPLRVLRRAEMRLMRRFFLQPAMAKHTQGYGFTATKV